MLVLHAVLVICSLNRIRLHPSRAAYDMSLTRLFFLRVGGMSGESQMGQVAQARATSSHPQKKKEKSMRQRLASLFSLSESQSSSTNNLKLSLISRFSLPTARLGIRQHSAHLSSRFCSTLVPLIYVRAPPTDGSLRPHRLVA